MFKIAVVITVYNRTSGLVKCLESVSDQLYPADEVLVVDDGSDTDIQQSIVSICQPFDGVSLFQHESNQGVSAARNTAVKALHSGYVIFLDDDDMLYPNAIESAHASLASEQADVLIRQVILEHQSDYWQRHYQRLSYKMTRQPIDHPSWFFQFAPAIHGMVFKTEQLKKNPFEESLTYGEDRVLSLQLLASGANFLINTDVVGVYRPGSLTAKNSAKVDFANYVLTHKLYHHTSQKVYLNLFKSLMLFREQQFVKAMVSFFNSLKRPGLVLHFGWVWFRR